MADCLEFQNLKITITKAGFDNEIEFLPSCFVGFL